MDLAAVLAACAAWRNGPWRVSRAGRDAEQQSNKFMSTIKPRTKRVAPWKLRIGMHIAPLRNSWEPLSSPYAYATMGRIVTITKGRAVFTGATVWRVQTSLGERLEYQGRHRTMQAEYATILTD